MSYVLEINIFTETQPQTVVVVAEESIEPIQQEAAIIETSVDDSQRDNIQETTLAYESVDKTTAPADTTTVLAAAASVADKNLEVITTPPHDESDYEDNITVTVPPAHLQSGEQFIRDQIHYNGRHGFPGMSTDMETPPKSSHQIQVVLLLIKFFKFNCY